MEQKTISVQKETKIRKKEETQTEISDGRVFRRTRMETLTETCVVETEILTGTNMEGRCFAQGESFPGRVRCQITECDTVLKPSKFEEDVAQSNECNVSQVRNDQGNDAPLDMSGKTSDACADKTSDVSESDQINPQNSNENEDKDDVSSSGDVCSSCDSFSTFDEIFTDVESKKSPDEPEGNESKYIENRSKMDSVGTQRAEASQSEGKSAENGSPIKSLWIESLNNAKYQVNTANCEKEESNISEGQDYNKNRDVETNDMYGKGDFSMISPNGNEENTKIGVEDKQDPEKSVSYLVNFFENIVNSSPRKNDLKTSELIVKIKEAIEAKDCKEGMIANGENIENDKFSISDCLESGDPHTFRSKKLSTIKTNLSISESSNKAAENSSLDTVEPSSSYTDEKFSNFYESSENFLVKRMPCIRTGNLKGKFRQPKKVRFLPPDENEEEFSNNISKTTDPTFIIPQSARRHLNPGIFRPVLPSTEMQTIQESDYISSVNILEDSVVDGLWGRDDNNMISNANEARNSDITAVKNIVFYEKDFNTCLKKDLKERKKKGSETKSIYQESTTFESAWKISEWIVLFIAAIGFLIISYQYLLLHL